MFRKSSKLLISFLAIVLLLSTFSMGAFANSKSESRELPTGELFGEINLASPAPTTVIVELEEESIVEAKQKGKSQSKSKLASERNKVVDAVKDKVKNAKVNREYEHVFSGFSVELPGNRVAELATIPGVKAVYPNVEYTVDSVEVDPEVFNPNMVESAPFIGSDLAWDAGYTGEGITVAVIDTGTDYTHPDLEHAFGEYKGWDFVDNDDDPQETPTGDPRGGSTNHGTHVAGTVAANGEIKGVAPEASLLAYRVLGPGGSGTTENVVAGIERAVQDGADVMNLSLGNTLNSPDFATSIALDWAMAEGVVAVTSNGNSGPNNWTVGSPGTSREAISVGASRLPYNVFSAKITTPGGVDYPSANVMGFPSEEELLALNEGEYEFVHVGLGAESDFEGVDVDGKIALISRGEYAFVDKATNAKNAGAVGAIIYNNVSGEQPDVPGMAIPTIKTTQADGQALLAELEAGNNTVSFDIELIGEVGETIADFSSRGPVLSTWMIKPDVSAPGVNITSTVPTHNPDSPHGYSAMQGTSMAAPHVAGAAALVLEANPNWSVEEIKAALMNTAEDLINPATGEVYPHNTQGAGSIRVLDAIETKTLVTSGSHSFGKFVKSKGKQVEGTSFTIKNLSNERKRYSFDVEFAGNPQGIKVMTSNNLNVQAGKTQNVRFNVQVDASKLDPGYYEGTIQVSDGTATIDVPTILFVGEPDYPRVTGAFLEKESEGTYSVGSYLPGGAEVLAYDLYEFNSDGTIGLPLGTIGEFANVSAPIHEFSWNGEASGTQLPEGDYVLAVYVEQDGVTNYQAYLVTKE
ncbi:S8 family serine peptidase [Halalkalibacter okhensis]|uniref:Peptidase S8 n=1 Tax=Halalkalibacter okhensis TaxID=333138 RepID=A0A0B0IGC2_9BACI|nr:S8 family serine peptidase [Halalkalibacter okhensis]KHF39124.1 peptidase S8 [Halalkalibacter okhensis]